MWRSEFVLFSSIVSRYCAMSCSAESPTASSIAHPISSSSSTIRAPVRVLGSSYIGDAYRMFPFDSLSFFFRWRFILIRIERWRISVRVFVGGVWHVVIRTSIGGSSFFGALMSDAGDPTIRLFSGRVRGAPAWTTSFKFVHFSRILSSISSLASKRANRCFPNCLSYRSRVSPHAPRSAGGARLMWRIGPRCAFAVIVRESIQLVAIGGVGLVVVGVGFPLLQLRTPFVSHLSIRMGHSGVKVIAFSRRVVGPWLFCVVSGGSFPEMVYSVGRGLFFGIPSWGEVDNVGFLFLGVFLCLWPNMSTGALFFDLRTIVLLRATQSGVRILLVCVAGVELRTNHKTVAMFLAFYLVVF